MNPKFIISHLDVQLGPFDEAELKAKWVKGEILPIDYVYDEGKQDWVLLSERFSWATGRAEIESPPPLREITVRKTRPVLEERPEPSQVFAPARTASVPSVPTPAAAAPASAAPVTPALQSPAPLAHPAIAEAAAGAITVKTALSALGPPPAAASSPTAPPPSQVKLVDGMGEVDLSSLNPGNIELVFQDATGRLKLQNPVKIQVRAAEPVAIEWTVPSAQQTVGSIIEITVRALDRAGHVCAHYEDHFAIRVNGSEGREYLVNMANGQASVKIQNTKAENWKLTFHYSGSRQLKLPAECAIEWMPGAAVRLLLDGPGEYVAGQPMKVQVKAVDEYGNLAKTFHGTVVLEVKAS